MVALHYMPTEEARPYRDLGVAIRHAREAEHLNQAEFAALAHISQAFVTKLERGKGRPGTKKLEEIARVLRADHTELSRLAGYQKAPRGEETITLPLGYGSVLRGLAERYTPEQLIRWERSIAAFFFPVGGASSNPADKPGDQQGDQESEDGSVDNDNRRGA